MSNFRISSIPFSIMGIVVALTVLTVTVFWMSAPGARISLMKCMGIA
jgi:hypothetical protein